MARYALVGNDEVIFAFDDESVLLTMYNASAPARGWTVVLSVKLPGAYCCSVLGIYSNNVYAIGGYTSSYTNIVYSWPILSSAVSWTSVASMRDSRDYAAVAIAP